MTQTPHTLVRPLDEMPGAMAVGYDPKARVVTVLRGLWDTHRHLREALFRVTAPMTVDQFVAFDRRWYAERNGR